MAERKVEEQREYRERSGQDLEDNPLEWKNWLEKMQAAGCMEKFCVRIQHMHAVVDSSYSCCVGGWRVERERESRCE